MSVAAIIPAYNEEKTIAKVIRTLRRVDSIDEVIVISDGSTDRTAIVAKAAGATKVIALKKNKGKGEAMHCGAVTTNADILFFCDADLRGLTLHHVRAILLPVREGRAAMCVGLRDRAGIPEFVTHIDPLLAIGGERAVRKEIFMRLTEEEYHGFSIEIALNNYCKRQNLPVHFVVMRGVIPLSKEQKWGIWMGLSRRIPWLFQMIRIRFLSFFR